MFIANLAGHLGISRCVNFTQNAWNSRFSSLPLHWCACFSRGFMQIIGVASPLLKKKLNTVDSRNGLIVNHRLSATNKLKNQQRL
jgi:hypothetical protein